jgi:hypothetical protein
MDTKLFNELKKDERFKNLPNKALFDILDFINSLTENKNNRGKIGGYTEKVSDMLGGEIAYKNVKKNNIFLKRLKEISELIKKKEYAIDDIATHFSEAAETLQFIENVFKITRTQAVLFAIFFDNGTYGNAVGIHALNFKDKYQALEALSDVEVLCRKRLLKKKFDDDGLKYVIPQSLIYKISIDTAINVENYHDLTIHQLFDNIQRLFAEKEARELDFDGLLKELEEIISINKKLPFCLAILKDNFIIKTTESLVVFLRFCELFMNNNDDYVGMDQLESIFETQSNFKVFERGMKTGKDILIRLNYIEPSFDGGMRNAQSFKLTEKAKETFLEGIEIENKNFYGKNYLRHSALACKKMFYNPREDKQIKELSKLLLPASFADVQNRLSESGMRKGFACLFYGGPGTGKTETAYQIAKNTGRDILAVDIAQTKSCWFGESEKIIKQVFDKYRIIVKKEKLAPILFFNEADAVISNRKELNENAGNVTQTENAIQNIILQELEKLDGILIATTNLTQNLDKAFERRFLYKIEFSKPDVSARKAIWKSIIPQITARQAETLAEKFHFSGGQIENIARKRAVNNIIHGIKPSLETLIEFCEEESLNNNETVGKIGFL